MERSGSFLEKGKRRDGVSEDRQELEVNIKFSEVVTNLVYVANGRKSE